MTTQRPDPTITQEAMATYGYTWDGMYPLQKDITTQLYHQGFHLYKLYTDGSEALIESPDEIDLHQGLFGVEKEDWHRSLIPVHSKRPKPKTQHR